MENKLVHKTIHIEYLKCAKNAWLKLYKKEELKEFFALSDFEQSILDKGNLVESWAQKLFPRGILIDKHGKNAISLTEHHIDQKTSVLFQAAFIHDGFQVRNDVLEHNAQANKWNLYEIKGKNSLEEKIDEIDHIEDASFQAIVLNDCGIELENIFIVHLNKNYVRNDDIDINELFILNNVTDKVKDRESRTRLRMQNAKKELLQEQDILLRCECIYKGRGSHCETFKYSHANVPNVSVHDIARISQTKLISLINSNIINIEDIPEDFELTSIQKLQVSTHKSKRTIVDATTITQELDTLTYPIYFLDYESYAHPIPLFKGFKPYQQIPFQFSFYRIDTPDSNPVYCEYVHETFSDPSVVIIENLIAHIGSIGTIVVWHKSFEQMIHNELGERNPKYRDFFENLNNRIFDLEEIFKKQYYIDHRFIGKTSIKNILPIFAPELSYSELAIQEGTAASEKWFSIFEKNLAEEEKAQIIKDLKEYCRLDTYGMYKIWQFLSGIR